MSFNKLTKIEIDNQLKKFNTCTKNTSSTMIIFDCFLFLISFFIINSFLSDKTNRIEMSDLIHPKENKEFKIEMFPFFRAYEVKKFQRIF